MTDHKKSFDELIETWRPESQDAARYGFGAGEMHGINVMKVEKKEREQELYEVQKQLDALRIATKRFAKAFEPIAGQHKNITREWSAVKKALSKSQK